MNEGAAKTSSISETDQLLSPESRRSMPDLQQLRPVTGESDTSALCLRIRPVDATP